MNRLRALLERIDGRGYKAYKEIEGRYRFKDYELIIDHVQGDPFADPSRIRVRVHATAAQFPPQLHDSKIRRVSLEDFLGRALARAIQQHVKGDRGTGRSGIVSIATSGQQILRRNAVLVSEEGVEARLQVGLPATGRSVLGRQAAGMFFSELPQVVGDALFYSTLCQEQVRRHIECADDQDYLRQWLREKKLVAFIGDDSILPRRSGVDDRPLNGDAVAFVTPDSLADELVLPHAGALRGMAIPEGVTLIVGGGFHGKSTLLHAMERGVYNHIPGDGREKLATDSTAVKVRAEDGRSITGVDISGFIDNLPFGRDTHRFCTDNASGSTSQAANIIEALDSGARVLLIDEDTSATNFMIRDDQMQALVSKEKEPITPLSHRIRELYATYGVSTILVMGGSGAYFSEADTVIMMDSYVAKDATTEARALARPLSDGCSESDLPPLVNAPHRRPDPRSLSPARGRKTQNIQARGISKLVYGIQEIDLYRVEQLVDQGQILAIGYLLHHYAKQFGDREESLAEGVRLAMEDVEERGLDVLTPYINGRLAFPRVHEAVAALNRLRGLRLH